MEKRTGLFADYVNTWLKIKEEASGWPEYVGNDLIKQREHVANYYAKEKIQLDPAKIDKNPGLRTLAKMMLNSMWGKFGQKPNKTQVKEFDDPVKFHEFHESDKYDIRYVSVLTEQRVEIHYKHQLQDDPVSPNLNIFIACFTTCNARLKLYEALDLLQERVLYFDTDSVIFKKLHRAKRNQSLASTWAILRTSSMKATRSSNLLLVDQRTMGTKLVKVNKSAKYVESRLTAKAANS